MRDIDMLKKQLEKTKHDETLGCIIDSEPASTLFARDESEAMRMRVESVVVNTKLNGLPNGIHKEELMNKGGKERRITAKMQAFASNIVKGNSVNDSYRLAYDCSNMAESSIATDANRLMRDERITNLLSSFWHGLKENIISDHQATRRYVLSELHKHASNEDAQLSNRIRSLELMGKAVGMFTDKVESKSEEVNVKSLKKELESSLLLLEKHNKTKTH